jgi:hypothetical protein
MSRRSIMNINVFKGAKTVVKNTTETSDAIDLRRAAQAGNMSVEYTVTGDGTLTLAYTVCSTKDGTYFTPTGASSIVAGLTKTSGTSGHGGIVFSAIMYPWIKITATETVNSANASVTVYLNVQ